MSDRSCNLINDAVRRKKFSKIQLHHSELTPQGRQNVLDLISCSVLMSIVPCIQLGA